MRLKKARNEKKYTQEYVAEHVNISPDLLRNIENGRNIGSIPTLLNLCNFLEISVFYYILHINSHKNNLLFHYKFPMPIYPDIPLFVIRLLPLG